MLVYPRACPGNFDLCETRNVAKDPSLVEVKEELYAKVRSLQSVYNLNHWEEEKRKREAAQAPQEQQRQ